MLVRSKPILSTLAALGLSVVSAPAFAEGIVIHGKKVWMMPSSASAGAWSKATEFEVQLHPQRTLSMNDRKANAIHAESGSRTGTVRALYNKTEFALLVSWSDDTFNQLSPVDGDQYGDAVALSLPVKFGPGVALPYIGMGDEAHPVVIAMTRSKSSGDQRNQFIAAGFGSMTPIEANTSMALTYDAEAHRWDAMFTRPLTGPDVDLNQGLVPFALAIWDGEGLQRAGYKSVMGWHLLKFEKHGPDAAYEAEVTWGENGEEIGDVAHGKELMDMHCLGCHRFADKQFAIQDLAPNLSGIGAYSSASYLRDSVVEPNKVVVRNPNINRHYDPSGERNAQNALPPNQMYRWYQLTSEGGRVSKMPPFSHLKAEDVNDIVAYMKTLGQPASQGGKQ